MEPLLASKSDHITDIRIRGGVPHVEDLALPKSVESGNFILAKAIRR
jgi:hypothetical protein